MKKISVIIPTYNRQNDVVKAVKSVINQTFKPYEIIVIDDGSTDNTKEVLSAYKKHIIYIKKENNGVSSARNRGIIESDGDWIAFLDSDDTWAANKLEKQIQVIEETNAKICFCVSTDEHGSQIGNLNKIDPTLRKCEFRYYPPEDHRMFYNRTLLVIPSMIVHKATLMKAGLFDELLKVAEDVKMIYRLVFQNGFSVINEELVHICRERDIPGLSDPLGPQEAFTHYDCSLQVQAEVYWKLVSKNSKAANAVRKNMLYFISRQAEITCSLGNKELAKRYAKLSLSPCADWKTTCRSLLILAAFPVAKKILSSKWTKNQT